MELAPHALVVPSCGQGHVVASMLLSQSLAALGFNVTFAYFSSYYSSLSDRGRLVLPIPELSGDLPPAPATPHDVNCAASSAASNDVAGGASPAAVQEASCRRGRVSVRVVQADVHSGELEKPFFVTSTMKENLYNLIVELKEQVPPPVCLISDSFVPWTVEVAQRAAIPRIEFWTSNAMAHLLIAHCETLYKEGIFPEKAPPNQRKRETPLMLDHIHGLPPFSSEIVPSHMRFSDATNELIKSFFEIGARVKSGERLLINTMSALEPSSFKAWKLQGMPAYGIGPLSTQSKTEVNDREGCLSWLTLQAHSSVIYVAFGSVAKLPRGEIQELAMGLEASMSPFLWVLSREDDVKIKELSDLLPDGFLERTSNRGRIVDWAPQVAVLAHEAIGGFLSHCGWNSTMESMSAGVPMLCFPLFAEQSLNCHYICQLWGAGLELERTETGGLDRSFVERGVKDLLSNEEGRKARTKAQEIMHLLQSGTQPGGQSFCNLQQLYDDMRALSSK